MDPHPPFPFKEPLWQLPNRSPPTVRTHKNPQVLAPPKAKLRLPRTLSSPASTPIPNSATASSAPISTASKSNTSPAFRPSRPKSASTSIPFSATNGRSAASPRRSPPLGIQHQPRFLPRRRPPRRRLPQLQPRIHAAPPPHHPLRKILRGFPYQTEGTAGG